MKMRVLSVIMLVALIIFSGLSLSEKFSTNNDTNDTLKITQDYEKVILDYLDNKTNNIAYSKKGKMYSAFKLLGTSQNKLYIWMLKVEYFKAGDNITHEGGDAVSLPVVLNVKKTKKGLTIVNHKYSKDGENYNKHVRKLFPSGIEFPDNDEMIKLEQIIKNRAEENFKKDF